MTMPPSPPGAGVTLKRRFFALLVALMPALLVSVGSAQWSLMPGPEGDDIRAFARTDVSILALSTSALYRSQDDGKHWEQLPSDFSSKAITSLVVKDGKVFAGTDGDGIYASTDEGTSWAPFGMALTTITGLAATREYMLAGTQFGLFRSLFNNPFWTVSDSGFHGSVTSVAAFGDTVFVSGSGGLWRSTTAGDGPWRFKLSLYTWETFLVAFDGMEFLGAYREMILRSSDCGGTWDSLGLLPPGVSAAALMCDSVSLLVGTGHGLESFRRTDATWTLQNTGLTGSLVTAFTRSGAGFLAGGGAGIYMSPDSGKSWIWSGSGLRRAPVTVLAALGDSIVAGTATCGLFLKASSASLWVTVNRGCPDYSALVLGVAEGKLYAGFDEGLYRSDDRLSWQKLDTARPSYRVTSFCSARGVLSTGTSRQGILRSADYGESWSFSNTGLSSQSVVALGSGSGLVLTSSYYDEYNWWRPIGGVFWSSDSGKSWNITGFPVGNGRVTALAARDGEMFAATDSGVYRTSGEGLIWRVAGDSGIARTKPHLLAIYKDRLLAGTDEGVYSLPVNGGRWVPLLPGRPVRAMFLSRDRILAASTDGIWTRPLADLLASSAPASQDRPKEFTLAQNFPNPFNPSTTIRYSLPERSHVTLSIFNAIGQLVATLIDADVSAGEHAAQFNAGSLPTGVYFYRLQAGTFRDVKRLVLIR